MGNNSRNYGQEGKGYRVNRRSAGVLATVMLPIFLMVGCGVGSAEMDSRSYDYSEYASESAKNNVGTAATDVEGYVSSDELGVSNDSYESDVSYEEEQMQPVEENQMQQTTQKLIKTVNMSVETKEFDQMMSTLERRVNELGGYIESMNTYNGSGYASYRSNRYSDMTIRIPKEQMDGFLNEVSEIGNVINQSSSVEDVTLSYVDIESHKNALVTEQNRLLELMEKAENIEDIITIEQRLSTVRYQIESMESQLRTYDNKVNYSTIYMDISEVIELTPVVEKEITMWEEIVNGFMHSLTSVIYGVKEVIIWFLIHIPYLLVWFVVIVLIVLFARFLNRRPNKNTDASKKMKIDSRQVQEYTTVENVQKENAQKDNDN